MIYCLNLFNDALMKNVQERKKKEFYVRKEDFSSNESGLFWQFKFKLPQNSLKSTFFWVNSFSFDVWNFEINNAFYWKCFN